MDHDLIYAKTASGEGAMLQRTRVMQRNVRMVLILVDSQSTVGDLCLKTGNPQLTENALRELEKGGFIEPRVEPDSLWEEGNKVAQEIRVAASNKRAQIASQPPKAVAGRSSTSVSPSLAPVSGAADWSTSRYSLAAAPAEALSVAQPASVLVAQRVDASAVRQTGRRSFVTRLYAFFSRQRRPPGKSEPSFVDGLAPVSSSPSVHGRFVQREPRVAPAAIAHSDAVLFKPVRRHSPSMGWPLTIVLFATGALALLFALVVFFPYDRYLPRIEAAVSSATGLPANVGRVRLDLYPEPALLLGNVRIGAGGNEIRVAEIRLLPAVSTLKAAKPIFREAVVSGVSLPAEFIARLPGVFAVLSSPAASAKVNHLRFERAEVSFAGLGLSGMNGDASLSADGLFQSLLLRSQDRRLSLFLTPLERGIDVALEGVDWRPSADSPFLLDSVNLKGFIENDALSIRHLEMRIFDGQIEGVAVLRAGQKQSLAGDVSFKRLSAARLGGALGLGSQFSGEAAGTLRFSTTADSWATIFSAIDADGEFIMQRGSIGGIDLAEAARSVSGNPVQGGATQFENLSGKIGLTPTNYRFSGLVVNSGLMQSTGNLDVSKTLVVSGKMELRVRGTANQTRVPMTIGGTLKAPVVQVGRGE